MVPSGFLRPLVYRLIDPWAYQFREKVHSSDINLDSLKNSLFSFFSLFFLFEKCKLQVDKWIFLSFQIQNVCITSGLKYVEDFLSLFALLRVAFQHLVTLRR